MTDSLIDKWFPVTEKLAIWNRNQVKFCIQGGIDVNGCEFLSEPHRHIFVEVQVTMFGLPEKATIEQATIFFGWELTKQVFFIYMTSNVPDEMVWTGHVLVGLNNN